MAWTTTPYATLAQVKSALDLQGTNDDAWLTDLLSEAQSAIDRYVGYPFQTDGAAGSPATRTYDGNGSEQLLIDYCTQITQVVEQNYSMYMSSQGIATVQALQSMDITADVFLGPANFGNSDLQSGYVLRRYSGMPFMPGTQNYIIKGVYGVPVVPLDITRACIRLAVHYYKMRDVNYADVMVEQGGVRQIYLKPLPGDVTEILGRYKRRRFFAW